MQLPPRPASITGLKGRPRLSLPSPSPFPPSMFGRCDETRREIQHQQRHGRHVVWSCDRIGCWLSSNLHVGVVSVFPSCIIHCAHLVGAREGQLPTCRPCQLSVMSTAHHTAEE